MKKLILAVTVLFSCVLSAIPAWATHFFTGSYQKALEKAKQEHKDVLLFFTAKWCGPCYGMEENVFPTDSITAICSRNYIAYKINVDTYSGERLADTFKVIFLPTFIVINLKKEVFKRTSGYTGVSKFYRFLSGNKPIGVNDENIQKTDSLYTISLSKKKRIYISPVPGINIGSNLMDLNTKQGSRVGYQVGIFANIGKERSVLRPTISFFSKGGFLYQKQRSALNYFEFSLPFFYTFSKTFTIISQFSGGTRFFLGPYYAKLQKKRTIDVSRQDYGVIFGLNTYMGETTQIECSIGYNLGLSNIAGNHTLGKIYNRGFFLNFSFLLLTGRRSE